MKVKRKIFAAMIVALVLALLLSVGAMAESAPVEEAEDNEVSESEVYNPAEEIYLFATENAEKIFSALALIGSLIVAFAYRRGLLPLIEKGLSALADAVGSIKKKTDEGGEQVKRLESLIEGRLALAEEALSEIGERLSGMQTEVQNAAERAPNAEELHRLLSEEVELLYSIFMSSSLPAYQKDEVERRISGMRKELAEDEGEEA